MAARFEGERSLPKESMVMVEFPGIVVNDAAAMETFGGTAGVAAAINTPGAMLPLHLRPDDLQSSAIFGDRVPTKNLVLRVVRRKNAPPDAPLRAEVVARVPEAFTYKGMADFQFLDLLNADRRRGEDLGEQGDDDMNEDVGSLLDEQADVPLQLVPPIFSKNDKPAEYGFRDHGAVSFAKAKYTRKIKWGEAVPESMSQLLASDTDFFGVMSQYRAVLEAKFKERPIWSGGGLRGSLPAAQHAALKALSLVAYTYTEGPWRRLWIRFGYDPSRCTESYMYQMVDFRVPVKFWPHLFPPGRSHELVPPAAGAHHAAPKLSGHLGGPQPYRRKPAVDVETRHVEVKLDPDRPLDDAEADSDAEGDRRGDGGEEAGAQTGAGAGAGASKADRRKQADIYRMRCLPNQKQCVLQVGDIDDDAIIQFLARCSKAAVCDAKYGWFSANDFQTLTELIHCKFLDLVNRSNLIAQGRSLMVAAPSGARRGHADYSHAAQRPPAPAESTGSANAADGEVEESEASSSGATAGRLVDAACDPQNAGQQRQERSPRVANAGARAGQRAGSGVDAGAGARPDDGGVAARSHSQGAGKALPATAAVGALDFSRASGVAVSGDEVEEEEDDGEEGAHEDQGEGEAEGVETEGEAMEGRRVAGKDAATDERSEGAGVGGAARQDTSAQALVKALTASARAAAGSGSAAGAGAEASGGVSRGAGGVEGEGAGQVRSEGMAASKRGIEKLLSDVLASASVAADAAMLDQELSDFEILDGDDDDSDDDVDVDDDEEEDD